jgi:predicted membrane channel-forming protein YqfA (hemolysin III family)
MKTKNQRIGLVLNIIFSLLVILFLMIFAGRKEEFVVLCTVLMGIFSLFTYQVSIEGLKRNFHWFLCVFFFYYTIGTLIYLTVDTLNDRNYMIENNTKMLYIIFMCWIFGIVGGIVPMVFYKIFSWIKAGD